MTAAALTAAAVPSMSSTVGHLMCAMGRCKSHASKLSQLSDELSHDEAEATLLLAPTPTAAGGLGPVLAGGRICAKRSSTSEALRLRRAVIARVGIDSEPTASSHTVTGPRHHERTFLREKMSSRYLSVSGKNSEERCVMTDVPASLFICHRSRQNSKGATMSFEHEGMPAFGGFLVPRTSWQTMLGLGNEPRSLLCESGGSDSSKEFEWQLDSTLQHVSTGLWVYVDPSMPDEVILHPVKKSVWEAVPTS
eukprot:TRINITY_DN113915_c0_g1_i1.p1 TRINITY_DN113915_c0_g1~~TRINITY_DN113915_c0_g1_i1.p1  ORF type:complete len:272 (+),score=34.23 TRINITY_DN113915_c0_g1_i1:64-816(+)